MKISSMFDGSKTVLSFEVFPPKRTMPIETIYKTLEQLDGLHPEFISVTYGAGGGEANKRTLEVASYIKTQYHIEPLMHMTCINSTKSDIDHMLKLAQEHDISNIMTLRGDIVPDIEPKDDFHYAADLAAYVKAKGDFDICGACYPEGHIDSPDLVTDVLNLRRKVDAGCTHLISQLFFDNSYFYSFMERAHIAGINVPIEAGIMPVTNKKQIERMVTLCGACLPPKFTKMMQRYEHHPEALADAGIAYAVDQIADLVAQGVDGIHLYTMNNPTVARRICESVGNLFSVPPQR